jgi:formylmethanofuran dehydrogenase subunit C
MPLTLLWRDATHLPVEAEGLRPDALSPLPAAEAARTTVAVGNGSAELGDLFQVEGDGEDGHLMIEGDLRHVRRIGEAMASGRLTIRGDVGAGLGNAMSGGLIEVQGAVGDWAGAEMRGGRLHIRGSAGRFLGSALPGSRLGMREGVILVEGSIGHDAGLAMRRGLIAVSGPSGDDLGRGMVAGSVFVFGPIGARGGAGMKRGTLALFGLDDPSVTALPPTFTPSGRSRPPFLTIYLWQLVRWGFPVPEAAFSGAVERYNGDLAVHGQGEALVWCGGAG